LDIKRIVGYRNFCNKLWNAVKFARMSFEEGWQPKGLGTVLGTWLNGANGSAGQQLRLEDRWILHRLSECARLTNKAFAEYKLYDATTATFNFWLYDFCDYYLEAIKPRTRAGDAVAKEVLFVCLDWGLRLIHPLMPFLSEELWQRLPHPTHSLVTNAEDFSICLASYPQGPVAAWTNDAVEKEFELVKAVIGGFRSLSGSFNIPPKERLPGWVRYTPPINGVPLRELDTVVLLGKFGSCEMVENKPTGRKVATQVVNQYCTIYLDIENVDMSAEISKLNKERAATEKFLDGVLAKKAVSGYEQKVPQNVQAKNNELEAKYAGKIAEIDKALAAFSSN
jgi:valyl-tRNA synthetase